MVVFSKLVPAFSSLIGKQTAKACQSFSQHLLKINTNTQYGVATCNRIPGATKVIVGQQQQRTFSSALFNTTNNNNTPPSEPLDELKQSVLTDAGVNDSKLFTLSVVEFKKWSKEQTTSVLCTPEEQGGAGLSETKVKPLYDAGFDGNSVGNIVTHIQDKDKYFAIERLEKQFAKEGILSVELSTTLQTVVFWVDNLLKTKLYHLWSADQVKEQLCKLIDEGGAGLNEDQVLGGVNGNSLKRIMELDESEAIRKINNFLARKDEELPKRIYIWLESIHNFHIEVHLVTFDPLVQLLSKFSPRTTPNIIVRPLIDIPFKTNSGFVDSLSNQFKILEHSLDKQGTKIPFLACGPGTGK